jgi:hypothetical protein
MDSENEPGSEREIVVSRMISALRDRLFEAWTEERSACTCWSAAAYRPAVCFCATRRRSETRSQAGGSNVRRPSDASRNGPPLADSRQWRAAPHVEPPRLLLPGIGIVGTYHRPDGDPPKSSTLASPPTRATQFHLLRLFKYEYAAKMRPRLKIQNRRVTCP